LDSYKYVPHDNNIMAWQKYTVNFDLVDNTSLQEIECREKVSKCCCQS
jgi:hypothetical protein